VGLGEYVQVFRGMFVKLGITGKESSAFGGFAFPFGEGKRGGGVLVSPNSVTNKTDSHDITEILLKMALNIITLTHVLPNLTIKYTVLQIKSNN
jgi:hypothetical protein